MFSLPSSLSNSQGRRKGSSITTATPTSTKSVHAAASASPTPKTATGHASVGDSESANGEMRANHKTARNTSPPSTAMRAANTRSTGTPLGRPNGWPPSRSSTLTSRVATSVGKKTTKAQSQGKPCSPSSATSFVLRAARSTAKSTRRGTARSATFVPIRRRTPA